MLKPIKLKNVKLEVNREFTTLAKLDELKQDWKDFSSCMTFGDLLRAFCDACDNMNIDYYTGLKYCDDRVVAASVDGWKDHYDPSCFRFELLISFGNSFSKISFYWDMHEGVTEKPMLLNCDTYCLERKEREEATA